MATDSRWDAERLIRAELESYVAPRWVHDGFRESDADSATDRILTALADHGLLVTPEKAAVLDARRSWRNWALRTLPIQPGQSVVGQSDDWLRDRLSAALLTGEEAAVLDASREVRKYELERNEQWDLDLDDERLRRLILARQRQAAAVDALPHRTEGGR